MPSTSETSFGARLHRGQTVLTYIQGFTGYNPPRQEESVSGYSAFLNDIITSNTSEANLQENYSYAVDIRLKAFKTNPNSVEKILSPISGAIQAQFGKKSKEYDLANAIIKQMRASKLIKPPVDPNNPEAKQAISQSERSYGSMTQFLNDLINTISQFNGYTSSNPDLTLTKLNEYSANITVLNNKVAQSYQALKTNRTNRSKLYTELKDRVQRIKAYVKAQYGNNSNEYSLIKGIKI